jgi:aryl sulfotransferase
MALEAVVWPEKSRELETRLMDSRRWNGFAFRDDDIVVDTWAKSGTTLMQEILAQLILGAPDAVVGPAISPWVDMVLRPMDEVAQFLEAQGHRRVLKSHLPLDALVFSPKAKYIFVGRDVRDVAWSLYNHQVSYTDGFLAALNAQPDHLGPKISRPSCDVRDFYLYFIETGGVFDPDAGAPYGGDTGTSDFWDHTQGFFDRRLAPNLLLVHYAKLKADLPGEIRRIARFLDMALDESLLPRIVEHCGIDHMRSTAAADPQADAMLRMAFTGGAEAFFNKGTNGRWKDVLTPAEIARADEIAARRLTPDCAHWLKTGELPDEPSNGSAPSLS